jgi:hypothetical protein
MTMNSRSLTGAGVNPEVDENLIKEARANLQTDFIIPVGGKLILTDRRLVFIPDKFSTVKQANTETIILNIADLRIVEKKKGDIKNLLSGSFRERLSVSSQGKSYIFQVWGVDGWLKSITAVIRNVRT